MLVVSVTLLIFGVCKDIGSLLMIGLSFNGLAAIAFIYELCIGK